MKKRSYFLVLFSSLLFTSLFAQTQDMAEFYNHDVGGTYNDCWGYVDSDGNEYAIVGTRLKIIFYDVTDPNNVVLIEEFDNGDQGIDLDNTTWRDFKTYGDKAYACADQGSSNEGLIIFDLSDLPNSVTFVENNTDFFLRAHNIFIDEATGYLYTAGANTRSNGTIIIDLNANPIEQVASVALSGGYIHDLYVDNNIGYCNSGNDGLYIFNFANPTSPQYLGSLYEYDGVAYNHSCWPTESGDHLVFCDETTGKKIKMVDISDPSDMMITDWFNSESSVSSSLAHNPFIVGDYAYVSYYDDGVYVFDISDPTDVSTLAYFDTNPGNAGGGCWGVYPFLPSGNIIATDMSFGFYLLEVTAAPLPVELVSFEAYPTKEEVKLEWTTASEENSGWFEVERSTDGINFENIGRNDALGFSSEKINYILFDEAPMQGENYYRLKQVDLDGKFEYSKIVNVYFGDSSVDIYPTFVQAGQSLSVKFSDQINNLQLNLYNVDGLLLQSESLSGKQGETLTYSLNDLPNGTYILNAINGSEYVTRRIVVAK